MNVGLKTLTLVTLVSCQTRHPGAYSSHTTLSVYNDTAKVTTVYVAFGSDSVLTAEDWSFCEGSSHSCSFTLAPYSHRGLFNPSGKYANATFSFDEPVGCGVTKAEININNPSWYDILDVSLVDGFSNKVQVKATSPSEVHTFGPPLNDPKDRHLYGVFPYGCDVCVARQDPPCGIGKGDFYCKDGTQYDPEPPCQWQGDRLGGGKLAVEIILK